MSIPQITVPDDAHEQSPTLARVQPSAKFLYHLQQSSDPKVEDLLQVIIKPHQESCKMELNKEASINIVNDQEIVHVPVQNEKRMTVQFAEECLDIESQRKKRFTTIDGFNAEELKSFRDRETTANTNVYNLNSSSIMNGVIQTSPTKFGQKQHKEEVVDEVLSTEGPQCRICLDNEITAETGQLHTPCICKGSLQYIHKECMWLQIKNKAINPAQKEEIQEVLCSVCKTPFRVEISNKVVSCSTQEWKENLKKVKYSILISFLLFVSFSFASYLLLDISIFGQNDEKTNIMFQLFSFFTIPIACVCLRYFIGFIFQSREKRVLQITQVFPDLASYQAHRVQLMTKQIEE